MRLKIRLNISRIRPYLMCCALDLLLGLFLAASHSALPWKIPIRSDLSRGLRNTATSENHGHDAKHDAPTPFRGPLNSSSDSEAAKFYFGSLSTTKTSRHRHRLQQTEQSAPAPTETAVVAPSSSPPPLLFPGRRAASCVSPPPRPRRRRRGAEWLLGFI